MLSKIFFPLPFIVILKVVLHLQIHSHFLGITRYLREILIFLMSNRYKSFEKVLLIFLFLNKIAVIVHFEVVAQFATYIRVRLYIEFAEIGYSSPGGECIGIDRLFDLRCRPLVVCHPNFRANKCLMMQEIICPSDIQKFDHPTHGSVKVEN